jgi:catechol-2,3-dioxygenase
MKTLLKAIVFKTSRLRETQAFFETTLGMKIEESSITHFVVYAKGIRILFVESNSGLEVEFYLTKKSTEGLTVQEDPNQIKIIIS